MVVVTAIKLGSIPAIGMFAFTLLGLGVKVPDSIAWSLQHLAAGILLASIGTELLPVIVQANGFAQCLSSAIGFFLGVAVLLLLGVLLPEHDEDGTPEDDSEEQPGPPSISRKRISFNRAAQQCACKESNVEGRRHGGEERAELAGENSPLVGNNDRESSSNATAAFPAALLIAMTIDAAVDGFLIGLVVNQGTAGPMLAASIAVEMGFLGLTLATALARHPLSRTVPAALLGPAALVGFAALGGAVAAALEDNPTLFVGLISFGVSALLFMVAEELLLEAHEGGEHIWWVDLQLYVGFFVSLMMGKVVGE